MPKASRSYCKSTPVSKMGFSQRASCKAQGVIKRSSGKKFKSPKYRKSRSSRKTTSRKTSRRR